MPSLGSKWLRYGLSPIQSRHFIPALNAWAAQAKYTTIRPIATRFSGHGCMDDHTTERSFYSQATWVFDVRGMLSKRICTIRHWQTSGRLVQELNVCTVGTSLKCTQLRLEKALVNSFCMSRLS